MSSYEHAKQRKFVVMLANAQVFHDMAYDNEHIFNYCIGWMNKVISKLTPFFPDDLSEDHRLVALRASLCRFQGLFHSSEARTHEKELAVVNDWGNDRKTDDSGLASLAELSEYTRSVCIRASIERSLFVELARKFIGIDLDANDTILTMEDTTHFHKSYIGEFDRRVANAVSTWEFS